MIAQRTFAVLAAMSLVGAVALALLGPPGLPLGQLMFMIDHDVMDGLRSVIEGHISAWVWNSVIVPLLVRPAWLVPASFGLIFTGAALSLFNRKPARRSHRRS